MQPDVEYLHGKETVVATFSIAKFRILPKGPRHVGQHVSFGLQFEQAKWPAWHWKIGGRT